MKDTTWGGDYQVYYLCLSLFYKKKKKCYKLGVIL